MVNSPWGAAVLHGRYGVRARGPGDRDVSGIPGRTRAIFPTVEAMSPHTVPCDARPDARPDRRPTRRPTRRRSAAALLAALVTLAGVATLAAVTTAPSSAKAGPTNAAKIFRWGNAQWFDNFIGPVDAMWHINKRSLVRNQHGMLTINATATSGTVSAAVVGHGRHVGRWEARVRAEQYSHADTPYHVVWELVPTYASKYHCGARSIVLADYALGTSRAHAYVRTLPSRQFSAGRTLDLAPGPFHTYAVEVTRSHVSWFVDTKVIRTERRPAALSDALYKVRFRLVGTPGARMNPGRMQMDWVRYYTMDRKNAQSISAPQLKAGTFAKAC